MFFGNVGEILPDFRKTYFTEILVEILLIALVLMIPARERPLACWDCAFESRRGHGCLSVESCVLSGRGLCVGLITRPEETYRLWCVCV